jgi:dTDP-4-dehydrorhamnose reductase
MSIASSVRRAPQTPEGSDCGVLIVGHGLIGGAVRATLTAQLLPTTSVGRRPAALPGYRPLDLASEAGRDGLRTLLDDLHPRCVVLVHGPSDVTMIESNVPAAAAMHCGVAEIAARSDAPVILVSTDNVFPGTRSRYRRADQVQPANAYGRVKSLAENTLLSHNSAGAPRLVLRVSLVYGWAGNGLRDTFAQRCLEAAAEGRPMAAPVDQSFTPVHVRDVAYVLAALCQHPESWYPESRRTGGIRHLAGPDEMSRYEFARLAYQLAGADTSLVRPCSRQETEWACRPRFSSLASESFAGLPGLPTWRPMTPAEGLRDMLCTRLPVPSLDGRGA